MSSPDTPPPPPPPTTTTSLPEHQQQQQLPSNFRPAKQISGNQSTQSGHLLSVTFLFERRNIRTNNSIVFFSSNNYLKISFQQNFLD